MVDEDLPRTHKKRYAKVTLYLEVPSNYEDEDHLASDVAAFIDENLKGFTTTAPAEAIMSEPGSDDIDNFCEPVGYLAPDGKFYIIESEEDGLAHLSLAPLVERTYRDTIDCRLMGSTYGLDYDLEKAGFIKVHCSDIRYLAHRPVHGGRAGWLDTPDPTEEQISALVSYARKFNLDGTIWVNERSYELNDFVKKIKQGDEFVLREIFNLH